MSNIALKTASVLAFERKLDPSDALMFGGAWGDRQNSSGWDGLTLQPKAVRGTISNRLKAKEQDPAKLDAAIENPNLQTVDVAALPRHADTLKVSFTLRVLSGTGSPSACNDAAYKQRLVEVVSQYAATPGFGELARRYAYNLANGRFLWRNRIGAEQVEVVVERLNDGRAAQTWTFDALTLTLRDFTPTAASSEALTALSDVIESGLKGEAHVLLRVTAYARIGEGQEVFPSQELVLNRERGAKSKTLYHVTSIAAIHSQKIGNAIRTVDTWYRGADGNGPIAIEPYGSVTTQGKAYRQPNPGKDSDGRNLEKEDFYNLLDNWMLKDKAPPVEQQHFVIATLIRGGVFGEAG